MHDDVPSIWPIVYIRIVDNQVMHHQTCVNVYFKIHTDCSYARPIEAFVTKSIIIRSMFAAVTLT